MRFRIWLAQRLPLPGLLASALALAGCAGMLPKLEPPQLAISAVVIGGGNAQQQRLKLTFHATNPNNREIAIRGIECNLELAGTAFAQGSTDAAFTLPALGATDFDLNVTVNRLEAARGHGQVRPAPAAKKT